MKKEQTQSNLALLIITSVILVIMTVALVNVGMSIIKESPQYDDYCMIDRPTQVVTQAECDARGGEWNEYALKEGLAEDTPTGYCDLYKQCSEEYDNAQKDYNQLRFYFLAIIGFILLIYGLHTKSSLIQYAGLGSGGILFLEGVVLNFENKIVVFISLLVIIAIFGYFAKKIIEK